MELRKLLFITCLVVGLGVLAIAWFFPINDDFRIENPFWNGCRDIKADVTLGTLESLTSLPDLPPESTVILVPYSEFSLEELDEIKSFVASGGRLVIADDYGCGNQVLEYLGLAARFSGQPMLDPLHCYKNSRLPVIYHFKQDSLTASIFSLTLNHATCLENVAVNDALAVSSSFSFLDNNGNGKWDQGENTGPLPVMSRQTLGKGSVVLISDPSVLINSMEGMEGNHQFLVNLVKSSKEQAVIDQSHLPPSNLTETKSVLEVVREAIREPFHALGVIALVVIVITIPVWRKEKEPEGGDNQNE